MQALAVYAKQAHDDELENLARRIKGRAVLRMGQIIKSIAPSPGARTDKPDAPKGNRLQTRGQAEKDAGLSPKQARTAKSVATFHEQDPAEAEQAIEAGESVTKMAERGTRKRSPPKHLGGRDPATFNRILHWVGAWERAVKELSAHEDLYAHLTSEEAAQLLSAVESIKGKCDEIETGIA